MNYNTKILTKEGNILVVLVTDPQNKEANKKVLSEKILPKLNVKDGSRYENFNETTDKLADYGLSALIMGGAGLTLAKKAGLLAVIIIFAKKIDIVLITGITAVWGFIMKRKNKSGESSLPVELDALDEADTPDRLDELGEPDESRELDESMKR